MFSPVSCVWSITCLPAQLIPGTIFGEVRIAPQTDHLFCTYREYHTPVRKRQESVHTEVGSQPEVTHPTLARTDTVFLISPQSPDTSIFSTLQVIQQEILDGKTETMSHYCTHFQTQTGQLSSKRVSVRTCKGSLLFYPEGTLCLGSRLESLSGESWNRL